MKNVTGWLLQRLLSNDGHQHATICEFAPGENIFRVGEPGDYLAVLLAGRVEIRKGEAVIAAIDPGGLFGEMGIIDGKPRVADAYAKANSRIAKIKEGQFLGLLEASPHFGLAVMRLLTDRIRRQIET